MASADIHRDEDNQLTVDGEVVEKLIVRTEENPVPRSPFESLQQSMIREATKEIFLHQIRRRALIAPACRSVKITRVTLYKWLNEDPAFKEAFELAQQDALDFMEEEAWKRATDGWTEPVFFKGEVVGEINRFSDQLMMFLLKGRRHEVFKDRVQNQHSNSEGDGPPVIEIHHDVDRETYNSLLADPESGLQGQLPVHRNDRGDRLGEDSPGSEMAVEEDDGGSEI